MAITPLAITTTLQGFRANVRALVGAVSVQESQLLDATLNDICADAVVYVRTILGRLVDGFYETESLVAESNGKGDISTLDIADPLRMTLWDSASANVIPLVSSQMYQTLRTIYSATALTNAAFARVVSPSVGGNNKLQIEVYRGASFTAGGDMYLTYLRNPSRATTDAGKIDLPEQYIPIAVRVAAMAAFQKLSKAAPPELINGVLGSLNVFTNQLGLKMVPN